MKVGIIGTGKIAYRHAEAIKALGHEVTAGCATNIGSDGYVKLKKLFPKIRYETDWNKMDVDKYVVCLPWNKIHKHIKEILSIEKPVLIEKPIALSSSELCGITYDSNKRVGFNRRFYKSVQTLKERIYPGGLRSVTVTISEDISSKKDRLGGQIEDYILQFSSIHTLDLMFYLFKDIKVRAMTSYPGRFSYSAFLDSYESAAIFLNINEDDPSEAGIECRFLDGTLWKLSPLEELKIYKGYDVGFNEEHKIKTYKPNLIDTVTSYSDCKPGIKEQMKAFLNDDYSISSSVDEYLEVIKFIEKIRTWNK